jgi:SAM-dependent methyltransferase
MLGKRLQAAKSYKTWKRELPSEVAFWKDWISLESTSWQDERRVRLDPKTPLQEGLRDLIKAPEGATVRLLDVGAGPATVLGKVWPKRTVVITAVDPLADEYNRMLDTYHVNPPVRTKQGDGERLADVVKLNSFDLAFSINALDHGYDPLKAIEGMVRAVKPGGWVVLFHYLNEAEQEHYEGLHQWNFTAEDNKFIIWNEQRHIVVEDHLPLAAEVRTEVLADGAKDSVKVLIQRK